MKLIMGSDKFSWFGVSIYIENPAGTYRSGTDQDGKMWSTYMNFPYGFMPIEGADGECLDVYVGPDLLTSPFVYIVNQHDMRKIEEEWAEANRNRSSKRVWSCPKCTSLHENCACPDYFDEHKVMLGLTSKEDAQKAYLSQYDDPRYLGPITEIMAHDFMDMLKNKQHLFRTIITPKTLKESRKAMMGDK